MTSINQVPFLAAPVVPNFGWYFGSLQRLPEFTYTENQIPYPPGHTVLGGVSNLTLPVANVPTGFGTLAQLQASFESQGTIVFNTYAGSRATVQYTGLAMVSSLPSFTGCTGGTGTFAVGTAIYDPRFYVDAMPLNTVITFDAIDHNNLGLPITTVPDGVTVTAYQWDFGNGQVGYGPFASTTYAYNTPPHNIQTTLTVTDSKLRTSSCAQQLNLLALTGVWGVGLRERQSNAGYR